MGTSNYSDEFKRDAVYQLVERGCPGKAVSPRLGVRTRSLYKRMAIRRTYTTTRGVFAYIELFCNPKRKHTLAGMLLPFDCETRQFKRKRVGGYKAMGASRGREKHIFTATVHSVPRER